MDSLTFAIAACMLGIIIFFWNIRQQTQAIASIVVVLGVFGTFLGIYLGLQDFDPNNIEQSIPTLLEGLKVAFLTSIIGIVLSVMLKVYALYERRKHEQRAGTLIAGATIDDLARLLDAIHKTNQEEGAETRDRLRTIEKALTGDGESTVVTQLQKLRSTFMDKQDSLLHAFQEFADKVAENNTQILIQALEEVMRDFNAKINEQFGENFKHLNEAVERILIWQEQYRQQMDELAKEFHMAAEAIDDSRSSLDLISARTETITSNAEKLEPILLAMWEHQQLLERDLQAFSDLREKAGETFPLIEERLKQLTEGFGELVRDSIESSAEAIEHQQNAMLSHIAQIQSALDQSAERQSSALTLYTSRLESIITQTGRDLDAAVQRQGESLVQMTTSVQREMTAATTKLGQQIESIITETGRNLETGVQRQSSMLVQGSSDVQREMTAATTKLGEQMEGLLRENAARITEQVFRLDEQLSEELTKSISSLGSQLASLSNKFVQDYTPLTGKLREVVQLANSIPLEERRSVRTND